MLNIAVVLILPKVSSPNCDTRWIFYTSHNHIICLLTIFTYKPIDSSRDRTGNLRLTKWTALPLSHLVAPAAEWSRYWIVAGLVTSSSPVPLKTRHVGERCTLNLSRAQTSCQWCGVGVRR
ncbi:hypothetical protein TNCV_4027061 [Trichonephila clavipes]|nr:hypothetical protein TNCV_4027061 [Trichonephila clavipes]